MAKFEFILPSLKGYYWDSLDGNIYSTKRTNTHAIKWSKRTPQAPKTAQLFTTEGDKFLLDERRLKGMLKGNPIGSSIYKDYCKNDVQLTFDIEQIAKKPFSTKETYIVIAIENGKLAPSTDPKAHCTLAAARAEAERLARLAPKVQFRVYKDCGTVQSTGVVWE